MNELKTDRCLTAAEAAHKILKSRGLFFGITFMKKDNSSRTMLARLGVRCGLRGGKSTTRHIPRYVTVWDVTKGAYRNVNLNTICRLATGGVEYSVA